MWFIKKNLIHKARISVSKIFFNFLFYYFLRLGIFFRLRHLFSIHFSFYSCCVCQNTHTHALAVDQLRLLKVQRHTGIACGRTSGVRVLLLLLHGSSVVALLKLSKLHGVREIQIRWFLDWETTTRILVLEKGGGRVRALLHRV